MKLLSKQFSIIVSLFLLVCEINAQNYEPAIAVPVSGISIDGNLTDWPKGLKSYEIGNLGFGELEDDKDCEATFMVAYNSAEKSIYLGVEVIDSKIVSSNSDNNIDLLDYMLLYLDPIHNPNGGSSLLFQAGGNLKEKFPAKPKSWNPYSPELTWEDVKVQTGQQNGKLIYEWKINLGNLFSIDSSYGLDFVISDIDEIEDGEIWKIWKNGMAKSAGAHRIGDLILAKDANSIGKIKGKVNIKDEKIKGVNEIRLQSIDLHNIWCRTIVDSLGNFSCELPEGAYEVMPWSNFTSHINSADFNQHSRKIINQERCVTKIKANSETLVSNLNLICEPHPLGLFEEKGLLISSTFNDYKIDNFIKTYQAYFDIPGVSVALIKDGEIVYDKTFGTANS